MEWSNNNDDTESEGCSLASYLDIWIVLWRCIGNVECREGGTNNIITITIYYYIAAKCTRNIPISQYHLCLAPPVIIGVWSCSITKTTFRV